MHGCVPVHAGVLAHSDVQKKRKRSAKLGKCIDHKGSNLPASSVALDLWCLKISGIADFQMGKLCKFMPNLHV